MCDPLRLLALSLFALFLHEGQGTTVTQTPSTAPSKDVNDSHLPQRLRQEGEGEQGIFKKEANRFHVKRSVEGAEAASFSPTEEIEDSVNQKMAQFMRVVQHEIKTSLRTQWVCTPLQDRPPAGIPRDAYHTWPKDNLAESLIKHVTQEQSLIRKGQRLIMEGQKRIMEGQKQMMEDIIGLQMDMMHMRYKEDEEQQKHPRVRKDCYEYFQAGERESGVYTIQPLKTSAEVRVWCDMGEESDGRGGGWTVFLKRQPLVGQAQVDFNKPWSSYRNGFGDPKTEYWMGNELLHALTSSGVPQVLRVDMSDWRGTQKHTLYNRFFVAEESNNYKLDVGEFQEASSTAGAALNLQNNMMFTTFDRDNDVHGENCASLFKGGFWFYQCGYALPTNPLLGEGKSWHGIIWYHYSEEESHLKDISMKIRPRYPY